MKNALTQFLISIKKAAQKNLGWKIFSLFVAISSWFVIINVTNPIEVWTFNVKMALTGVDELTASNNVVVQNQKSLEGKTVTAKIRGDRLSLEALYKRRSELIASVNLNVIYDFSLEHDVLSPIDIIIPSLPDIPPDNFDVVAKNPNYAEITLEGVVTEERSVTILTVGDPKEGYVAHTQESTPKTVNITGPKSKLKEIKAIVVETSIGDKSEDISTAIKPALLDNELNAVEGVSCDTPLVDVVISIDKLGKIPISSSHRGAPAEGYTVSGIEWAPKFIEIVGEDADINEFKEIVLPPVNVTGLSETSSVGFDVENMGLLPERLHVRHGAQGHVTVTVNIEPIEEKEFSLPISSINTTLSDVETDFSFNEETINITAIGAASKIKGLEEKDFKVSLNIPKLEPGEYTLLVTVETPEGITQAGGQPSVTVIVDEPPVE